MHVTVGYWIHGVTILHEEGTRNADEAGASGSPSDKGTWGLSSCSTERDPAVVRLCIRLSRMHSRLPVWSSSISCTYGSLPYHVRAFPTFFVSLQLEHPSSILCFMTSPYAGMQCRCGYDFDEAMFHTAWYLCSQTPFSIFEPFYGGIVNSKQSNLGKVHENAVPCSLVNAIIRISQRVMQQCRTRPNAQPDPVIFWNAAMLR